MYYTFVKRKVFNTITALMILMLFSVSVLENIRPLSAFAQTYEEKLKAAEDNLAELEKKKKEASDLLKQLKEEKDSIAAYIQELDLELNNLTLELFELDTQITETEEELERTREALAEAKAKEEKQYDTMKKRIRYMYENSDTSFLETILSSGNIADILNQMEYMYRITDYDNTLLDKYNAAKQEVEEKQLLIEASLAELESLQETKEFERQTVSDLMDAKNKEIEQYTERIGITDELLFAYLDEISDKEADIEAIKEEEQKRIEEEERKRRENESSGGGSQRDDQTKPPSTSGYDNTAIDRVVLTDETDPSKFIWPLPGDYRTYSKFGPRIAPIAGASTYHKGWDIGGEFGAPVVAVLAGRVVVASYNSSAGNYVRIDHGNGLGSAYCHFSKILVSEGDYVKQGQKVGLVGSTGVSTAPHLHFGVLMNGSYIDPAPYMPYN